MEMLQFQVMFQRLLTWPLRTIHAGRYILKIEPYSHPLTSGLFASACNITMPVLFFTALWFWILTDFNESSSCCFFLRHGIVCKQSMSNHVCSFLLCLGLLQIDTWNQLPCVILQIRYFPLQKIWRQSLFDLNLLLITVSTISNKKNNQIDMLMQRWI